VRVGVRNPILIWRCSLFKPLRDSHTAAPLGLLDPALQPSERDLHPSPIPSGTFTQLSCGSYMGCAVSTSGEIACIDTDPWYDMGDAIAAVPE